MSASGGDIRLYSLVNLALLQERPQAYNIYLQSQHINLVPITCTMGTTLTISVGFVRRAVAGSLVPRCSMYVLKHAIIAKSGGKHATLTHLACFARQAVLWYSARVREQRFVWVTFGRY